MNIWPEVDLTEYERLFVRTYKTTATRQNKKTKKTEQVVMPGVLKRVYNKVLVNQPIEGFYLAPIFEEQIKISRRARIFALVFTGDTFAWSIRLQNSAGTLFTINTTANSDNRILVSSMIPGQNYDIFAQIGTPIVYPPGEAAPFMGQQGAQSFPLLIEPNWVLMQNDTFMINGLCHAPEDTASLLGISVHVWEFPGMEASTVERAG